ncbi:MAG: alpha/beta fold hydrolase [Polyangiaceae bacterium]
MPSEALDTTLREQSPRSVRAVVEGIELHWLEYGPSTGRPPVLLLHGLSDSHLTWSRVAPELARDRRVLVLDLPGHGFSARPDASYELRWYARVVAAWIESLGIERLDVVGHSLGGGIALMLLLHCRPRIRRVVLEAAGGLGKEVAWVLRFATLRSVLERFAQPFMAFGAWLTLGHARANRSPCELATLKSIQRRPGTARAFARTVSDLIDWHGQRHSFFHRAAEVAELPPIAVVWGDRDAVLPIEHGRAFARAVRGVSLVEVPGAGHSVHHDDVASFLRVVHDALNAPRWPVVRLRPAFAPALAAKRSAPVPAAGLAGAMR